MFFQQFEETFGLEPRQGDELHTLGQFSEQYDADAVDVEEWYNYWHDILMRTCEVMSSMRVGFYRHRQ
jgi:hypothetical protein